MKTMKFAGACKEFFGMKNGQTLAEFAEELKALTPKDRQDIVAGFRANGIEITNVDAAGNLVI